MIFTGVLINAVLVIVGTMIGLIFKGERLNLEEADADGSHTAGKPAPFR